MARSEAGRVPGSFRDPAGRVHQLDGRVFRTVTGRAIEDFEFVLDSGFYEEMVQAGRVVAATPVDQATHDRIAPEARAIVEHPRLAIISHPYEWTFEQLKAAALLHLDLQIDGLARDVMLSDATAYNVQFVGPDPIFIDTLSFRRYREGEYWAGHRQFTEQFLVPLLLRSLFGIAHNAWYRGRMEGIPAADLVAMLSFRQKLSLRVLTHLVLPARFDRSARSRGLEVDKQSLDRTALPRIALDNMWKKLRNWIATLDPKDADETTVWKDYADQTGYVEEETQRKRDIIAGFVREFSPGMVWDLGCNSGDYSEIALENGASHVVGWDFDEGALAAAFDRAREKQLAYTTLYFDAANPAPNQGWAEGERQGMIDRGPADAILALAFVHHLIIAKNVPLEDCAEWLTKIGRSGVVEFVDKSDPMVEKLLVMREDIFDDYSLETFLDALGARAEIVRVESLATRHLITFRTKDSTA